MPGSGRNRMAGSGAWVRQGENLLISVLYSLTVLWLGVYAFQSLLLTILYLRHRRDATPSVEVKDGQWPRVAVQLPIFNERHVVERLIDAAAALDYPSDR